MYSFKKRHAQYILLFLIVLAAFVIRMATFKLNCFLAYDPAHHYKIAEYVLEKGEFPIIWQLSRFPFGSSISEPMGLYYISVILYKILNVFGLSFFQVFKLAPAIFGSITLVPMYLLTRDVFSKRAGFYAITILAFLPANLHRTAAGYYRGDAFFMFFAVLSFYLFIKSIKDKSIPVAVLAGLSFGLMGLAWNGYLFGFVIAAGFMVLYAVLSFIQGKSSKDIMLKYVIFVGTGILVVKYSMLLQPARWDFTKELVIISAAALFVSLALDRLRYNKPLLLVLIAISLVLAFVFHPIHELLQKLLTGYGMVKPTGFPYDTISELKPISEEQIWNTYRLTFILFPLGFIYLLKEFLEEKSAEKLFLLVWVLASFYLLYSAVRYAFISSVPFSILGGLLLYRLEVGKILQPRIGAYIITASMLISIVAIGTNYAYGVGPTMSPEWHDAITSLETQERGNVLIWWDFGSWIQGMTGFPTTLDGVHGQKKGTMKDVGLFFKETNKSKRFDMLRRYHVKYVVVPDDMIRQLGNVLSLAGPEGYRYNKYTYKNNTTFMGYQAWYYRAGMRKSVYLLNISENTSENTGTVLFAVFQDTMNKTHTIAMEDVFFKDRGKPTYLKYTSDDVSRIVGPMQLYDGAVYVSRGYLYSISPKLKDTILTDLLFMNGKGFEGYKLIFSNWRVKIYKATYNYSWIGEVRTQKFYYEAGENVDVNMKIESTLPFNGRLEVEILDDGNPWTSDDDTPFYEVTYDVNENFTMNLTIAVDNPGFYRINSRLYEDDKEIDHTRWYFKVD